MTRSSPSLCKRSEDSSRSRRFVPVLACPAKKEEDTFHFPYSSICTSTGFVLQKKKETLFAFHIRLLLVLALSYRKRRFSLSILIDLYQYSLVLQKKTLFTFHTRQFVRVLSCPAKKEHFSLSILVDSYKYSSVPQKKLFFHFPYSLIRTSTRLSYRKRHVSFSILYLYSYSRMIVIKDFLIDREVSFCLLYI